MVAAKIDLWNQALHRIGEDEQLGSETEDRAAAKACALHYPEVLRRLYETREWRWATREATLTQINTQTVTATGDAATVRFDIGVAFHKTTQVAVTVDGTTQTAGTDYNATPAAPGDVGYITFTAAPANSAAIVITITTSRAGWTYVYSLPADYVRAVGFAYGDMRFDLLRRDTRQAFEVMVGDDGTSKVLATDLGDDDYDAFVYVAHITNVGVMPAAFSDAVVWFLAAELAGALKRDLQMAQSFTVRALAALGVAISFDGGSGEQGPKPLTPGLAARN